MNSKTEDFPTPISPTRRMVYGAFALFFNVLTIPCLRDSTSLEDIVRTDAPKILLKSLNSRVGTGVRSGPAWASRNVDRFAEGDFFTGRTAIQFSSYRLPVERLTSWARLEQRPTLLGHLERKN